MNDESGISPGSGRIGIQLTGNWLPILRLTISLPILLLLFGLSLVLKLLLLPFPRYLFIRYNTRLLIYPVSKLLFRVIGTRLEVEGRIKHRNQVVVSNHQGVLDSMLLMALSPCMVVSSSDIRSMKGIGWVMAQLGFVFVNRTRHSSIPQILAETNRMVASSKINIGFFPEGWSDDGLKMRRFRSSFFDIATATHADVQPLVFHYAEANGQALRPEDVGFFVYLVAHGSVVAHVFNLLKVRSLRLRVQLLEPISAQQISSEGLSRKDICDLAETRVSERFYQRFNRSGV